MLRRAALPVLALVPALVVVAVFAAAGARADGTDVAACQSPAPSPVAVSSPTLAVAVTDAAFDPDLPRVRRGTTLVWTFAATNSNHHTVTDVTGMHLFDSGSLGAGAACSFTFTAAGDYDYVCIFHANMTGRVHVPVWASPHRGTRATTFHLAWSAVQPASGFVFDVRVRSPHGVWRQLRGGTTSTGGTFAPHGGTGVYLIEARMRQPSSGGAALWSDPASITVR